MFNKTHICLLALAVYFPSECATLCYNSVTLVVVSLPQTGPDALLASDDAWIPPTWAQARCHRPSCAQRQQSGNKARHCSLVRTLNVALGDVFAALLYRIRFVTAEQSALP